jgi:hypothetical protein
MKFNARLDTSHHGRPHASKDAGVAAESDRHPKCDGEVPLRCLEELHTQGLLSAPTGKNPEDSNVASVEAIKWVLLRLSIDHDIENISHSAAKMCRSTMMHVPHSCFDCQRYIFQ